MTWKNSNYSSSDLMSMQQDAVRRVREMQRIANSKLGGVQEAAQPEQRHSAGQAAAPVPPAIGQVPGRDRHHEAEREKTAPPASSGGSNPLSGILSQLNLDHDRLIILLLLIVLMNEGADQKLLLALCYLLL